MDSYRYRPRSANEPTTYLPFGIPCTSDVVEFSLFLYVVPTIDAKPRGRWKIRGSRKERVRSVYLFAQRRKYPNDNDVYYVYGYRRWWTVRKDYRAKISDNGALVVCLHRERVHSRCNSGTCKTFKDEACLGTRYASENRSGATPPRETRLASLFPSFSRKAVEKGRRREGGSEFR